MTKNYWWLMVVIAFVTGIMISSILVQAEESKPREQWEYTGFVLGHVGKEKSMKKDLIKFNELGADGWELVLTDGSGGYYFKRRINH